MSDTTDTSVHDSPPGRRKPRRPISINRGHFQAALRILETDLTDTFPDDDPVREKFPFTANIDYVGFKRSCSLDLSVRPVCGRSARTPSKARLLTYALTNSVFRHDWSTAARCVQLMLDMERCSFFVYRSLLLVLFNHPHSNTEVIVNFMNRVLNLNTRSEQLTFLRQMFFLPDDIEEYTRAQNRMSTKMEDEDMTTSEDEE